MTGFERFIGRIFDDRYTIVSVIGEGESAVVFGAFDGVTGDTVALKMLRPDCNENSPAAERFETEIRLLSQFDHPNIVRLLDSSAGGDYRYFVMEYIEGITLKKHIIGRGALEMDEILFLSKQILSALSHVHEKGIVHSDIKPQNIVIVGSGNVKLMDFGISKTLSNQTNEISDTAVGTVQYVSPEQAEGKPLDYLSDLYSFGVMLYEMATGILPFIHENANRIAAMHVSETPIPPSFINESVSPGLEKVILRAMEKQPVDRFLSANEFWTSLENAKNETGKKAVELSLDTLLDKKYLPSLFVGVLSALLASIAIGFCILGARFSEQKKTKAYGKIPDLEGRPLSYIEELDLDENFYEFEIKYVEKKKQAGLILSQSPSGGKVVKDHAKITLKVAKLPLPSTLPDLTCMSEDVATRYLQGFNCEFETVYLPHFLLPKGEVLGAVFTGEDAVRLYVSDGYRENPVTMPNFVELTREEASAKALENGIVGILFSVDGDKVTEQSIPAGVTINGANASPILTLGK